MPWQELYTQHRKKLGKFGKTKKDIFDIMSHVVTNELNVDPGLKTALLNYITNGFDDYNSVSGYKTGVIPPVQFVHWLSENKAKTITLEDFSPPNMTIDDAKSFIRSNTKGESSQAILRSSLKGFTKYLISRYKISRDPFVELKVDMVKSKRKIVFNAEQLDEFFNIIMFGAKSVYLLYWRMLLSTGLRPSHAYILKCSDIDRNKPVNDALGRKFYPIYALDALSREKKKRDEKVKRKNPAETVYIGEELANDITKWCSEQPSKQGYIFKDSFYYISFKSFIISNRESEKIKPKLKYNPEEFIVYALRHTWATSLFNITGKSIDPIRLGGWDEEAGTPFKYYIEPSKSIESLDIAKKWGIYIPPERAEEVKAIEQRRAGAAAQPQQIDQAEAMRMMQDQVAALVAQINDMSEKMKKAGIQEAYGTYY